MDKVIIDGIDVSECKHFVSELETEIIGEKVTEKDKCHYSGIEIIQNCKGNKGCIYKQLKRLEQENEKLKSNIYPQTNYTTQQFYTKEEYDKLQAENERLKEEITKLSDPRYQISKVNEGYYNRMNTYKQALQEIRVLIKKLDLSLGCAYGDYDCDNCSDINEETVCKIKLQNIILAKINEVIGVE